MKYLNKHGFVLLFLVTLFSSAHAAVVDTVSTYSSSMKKNIKAVVITPDNYSSTKNCRWYTCFTAIVAITLTGS